ncbi:MAG TPA: TIGR03435 family protein [Bryobacteraceae bacterium]|jgi:uncharacterized protein (TIGR03435 family)|nr:TIGR03435 family protein [Bryobacteraceae bacterium]
MYVGRIAILACLVAATAVRQRPTFDAVSAKVVNLASHPVFGNRGGPGTSDPGRVHLCCVGMFSLLMTAYDAELDRIIGPPWIMENMGPNLYEVDATMPADTTKAQYQLMMQRFLEERFHLAIHRETRNFPGYELVIAEGGPKLKESTPDTAAPETSGLPKKSSGGLFILPRGPQMFTSLGWGVIVVQVQQKPIGDLVKALGRMINQSLGENPNDYASPKARVLDRTGLTGTYDFTLRFFCELCQFAATNGAAAFPAPPLPADSPGGEPGIFTALRKQLGLKLNKVKDVPLDMIVVDHAEKIPTAN